MKKNDSTIFNFLTISFMQIVFNLNIFNKIDFSTLIFIISSSIISSLIINILSRLTKNIIVNKIINLILSSFFIIIIIGQFVHYKFYDSIFSIYSMISGAKQVMGFFDTIILVIKNNFSTIFILLIPFILMIIFNKKINFERIDFKKILIFLGIILISFTIPLLIINISKKEDNIYSKYNLYYNVHFPTQSVKEFGLAKTFSLDIYRYITKFEDKIIIKNVFNEETFDNNNYNILNIDFDNLIEKESDKTIKEMHEYFKQTIPTLKNKYTGIFEGKNLIFITGESVNINAIDENITPTLYKLTHNGFVFNNFYTPIYYTSTSDGEWTSLVSLLPTEGVWSFTKSINNDMKFALGNMFKSNNYKTFAYHNNSYEFYNRNKTHPNIGFDKFLACGNGLEKRINCNVWPESDFEMFSKTYTDYYKEKLFVAYYMTVSTHLSYTWEGNYIANKNKDLVKNLDLSETSKGYIATHIELDKALKYLMEELEKENILDDTVIVLVADHYPYGLKNNEMYELNKNIKDEKFDIHKNFLAIYNSEIKDPIFIDKYASNIDILPTLYNLFNIKYDSRLLIGKDILADNNDGIVIFNDRSFITKDGKYNSLNNSFIKYNEVSNGYLENKINEVYNKYLYSRLILEKDYYKYIK